MVRVVMQGALYADPADIATPLRSVATSIIGPPSSSHPSIYPSTFSRVQQPWMTREDRAGHRGRAWTHDMSEDERGHGRSGAQTEDGHARAEAAQVEARRPLSPL